MLSHRFQDYWQQSELEPSPTADQTAVSAFMPWPCPAHQSTTFFQHGYMQEIYRLAYEQARAQVVVGPRSRYFDFSSN